MAGLTCRTCGSGVIPEFADDYCPSCGEWLSVGPAGSTGPSEPVASGPSGGTPPVAVAAPTTCPHCGAGVLNPANRACTDCLRPFPDRVPDTPLAPPRRPSSIDHHPAGRGSSVSGTRRDDTGSLSLTFSAGGAVLGRLEIRRLEDLVVGRLPGLATAALVGEWDNVSREHARIGVDADGTCWVSDENSTNGTLLNGSPVRPGSRRPVHVGDSIRFGADVTATVSGPEGR